MQPSEPFAEDEAVRARLADPVDVEAFTNLMATAHRQGKSAAAMIREEPNLTSRPAIRGLCVGEHKARFLGTQLTGFLHRLGRPLKPPRLG